MTQTNVSTIRPGFLITSEWLEDKQACRQQVGRFKNVYPKGMQLNTRNLNIARSKYRLSTQWLIQSVLDWDEWGRLLYKYSGVNARKVKWTAKDAKLLHSAFLRVLKERGNK